jgi:hypothetical protein
MSSVLVYSIYSRDIHAQAQCDVPTRYCAPPQMHMHPKLHRGNNQQQRHWRCSADQTIREDSLHHNIVSTNSTSTIIATQAPICSNTHRPQPQHYTCPHSTKGDTFNTPETYLFLFRPDALLPAPAEEEFQQPAGELVPPSTRPSSTRALKVPARTSLYSTYSSQLMQKRNNEQAEHTSEHKK